MVPTLWNVQTLQQSLILLSYCTFLTKKCIIKTFAGKVLYKGKEQKLEERRQAGADMKRNPGYAIDQLIAAVSYQLNLYVVAKGIVINYFSL